MCCRHAGRLHSVSRNVRSPRYRGSVFAVHYRAGAAPGGAQYHSPPWRAGDPAFRGRGAARSGGASIGVTCASVTRRGGSAPQKAEFRVRMAPVGWTYFSCFRRSGEMGLFLLVVWCSIVVGRHGSRFGDFNFRLGRREFPVRGAAGICRQGLDLLYRLRGPTMVSRGKSTKFRFRREKPGISPHPSEERGTSATVAPVIPPLESRRRGHSRSGRARSLIPGAWPRGQLATPSERICSNSGWIWPR